MKKESSNQNIIRKGYSIIVAVDEHYAIGRDGDLLCHLPNDLKHFKNVTSGHTVIMGRRTFESLPKGALPNRKNIVITSAPAEDFPNCVVCRNWDEVFAETKDEISFIIGGGMIYKQAIEWVETLYLTRIHHKFDNADTFFPAIDNDTWNLADEEKNEADERHAYPYTFLTYKRK